MHNCGINMDFHFWTRTTLIALTLSFIRRLKLLWLCCSAKAFDEVTRSLWLMPWLLFHQNQQPVALPRTCLCFYPYFSDHSLWYFLFPHNPHSRDVISDSSATESHNLHVGSIPSLLEDAALGGQSRLIVLVPSCQGRMGSTNDHHWKHLCTPASSHSGGCKFLHHFLACSSVTYKWRRTGLEKKHTNTRCHPNKFNYKRNKRH